MGYWWRAALKACSDTLPHLHGKSKRANVFFLLRWLLIYAFAFVFIWLVLGRKQVIEEGTIALAFGLPVAALIAVTFFLNLLLAPIRMEREAVQEADNRIDTANTELAAVLEKNARLIEERIPKICAVAHARRRMLGIGAHLMWAELEVENTSPTQPLLNTKVRVVTCEYISPPLDGSDEFKNLGNYMWDWSPITLRWAQSDSDGMDIPGGASRTVLVAFSDNSNGPPAVFNDIARTRCSLELKIMIEISGPSSAVWRTSYFIECHGNYVGGESARFEFLEWGEWESSRTVIDVSATG